MRKKILIVEDDAEIVDILSDYVSELGFAPEIASSGDRALKSALENHYELILLDLVLPELTGTDICREIRKVKPNQPIIMVTSKADEVNRVLGLEIGADDYITKPFSPSELQARIKAVLRRSQPTAFSKRLAFGDLVIDLAKRKIWKLDTEVNLTSFQFDILALLATQPGRPLRRDELNRGVFGSDSSGVDQNIAIHISRIRAKLEDDPAKPKWIKTVRGVGYCFCDPDDL